MKKISQIQVCPYGSEHGDWARQLIEREWGGPTVISRGREHHAADLPGYVAELEDQLVGLVTYRIDGVGCELVTLNSLRPKFGVGLALVSAVKEKATAVGCHRLWLITTNDNLSALRFYQQRGFKLAALHRNALERSRILKPQIPHQGADGIAIRDEIELEIQLDAKPRSIIGLHHAQITIPNGAEEEARRFYCDRLSLTEIEKPVSLKTRGGFWIRVGDRDVHIGTEDDVDRSVTKAHLAFQVANLRAWWDYRETHGIRVKETIPIPGFVRFEIRDPFGNRLELIEILG